METLTVKDIMNKKVLTIEPDKKLRDAARIMNENDVGSLIVVKGGEVVGIITERDVVRATAEGLNPDETKVSDLMTTEVFTVLPETSVLKAIEMMRAHGIRHLPVVDGEGRLVGIVSLRDLAHAAALQLLINRIVAFAKESFETFPL